MVTQSILMLYDLWPAYFNALILLTKNMQDSRYVKKYNFNKQGDGISLLEELALEEFGSHPDGK